MPRPTKAQNARPLIDDINKRLDSLEGMMVWLIDANLRFKKGQRVEWSPLADRKTISRRTKGGARKGKIMSIKDRFTVEVLIDGYSRPIEYHHGFWQPITRRKAA